MPYQLPQDWPPGPPDVVIDLATRQLVPSDDPEYLAWVAAGNTVQPAAPALNGVYRVDVMSQQRITAVYVGIKGGDGLPGNGATFSYLDMTGVPHSFTADQFVAFAKAVRDYVYALTMAAMQPSPVWPSNEV